MTREAEALTTDEVKLIFMEIDRISPGLCRLIHQGAKGFKFDRSRWALIVMMPHELAPAVNTDRNRYNIRLAVTRATGHLLAIEVEGVAP